MKALESVKLALLCLLIVWGINFIFVGWFSVDWEVAAPNFLFGFGVISIALYKIIISLWRAS